MGGILAGVVSAGGIRAALWGKPLYKSALYLLSIVFRVAYIELGNSSGAREIMRCVLEETFAVMDRKCVRVPFRDAEDYHRYLIERQLPPMVLHCSSMLQDISRGRLTEIDVLNREICW